MSRVPAIRFKGFTDPWEQRKLGNCGTTYGGLSGKTKEDFGHGNARFVPYTNVFDNPLTDTKRLETVEIDSSQNKVAYGDTFFTVSSETPDEVGMSSVWLSDQDDVYLNSFCFGYRQDSTFDPHYLAYMLRSSSIRSDLTLLAQGISRFNISKNKVMELSVPVPSAAEQKQIGQYFARLDSLITLHQRKYDKLCTVKKSMLDKMFPKPGELVPEIRFEGFTDPWEQRKFSDFVQASGIRNSNNLDLQSYSVSNEKGFVPQNKQFENGGTMAEADKTAYWIVAPGSFAYNPARINVGSIGYLSTCEDVIVSSLYEVFKTDETCDDHFLWHWFKSPLFLKQIEMYQEGGVRLYFFFDKLLKSEIWMPSVDEQQQISSAIDNTDHLITLHQRKYDKLCTVKKSMLDKMFPKPGELVPEIRFEGFTDPWEQRKFSDFVQASGIRNSNNLDLQSYSVSNEKGFVPQNKQFENGGTMAEADKTAYWIVAPGSFAYNPARINVGSIGYLSTCEDVIVSSLYEVFKTDETCDDHFLWHWFKSPLFLKQIEMYQEGGVRLYFFFDKLLKSEIWMPSVDEQQQISSAIDNTDHLITLHQRKLELLKNVKKSLLDKMFV